VKYLSSIDRHVLILNQITLNNMEGFAAHYSPRAYEEEDVLVFTPRHNVFGGQTGIEAADSGHVFRSNYNSVTEMARRYAATSIQGNGITLEKDWGIVIPRSTGGVYSVRDVAEWLWNRFIGDGLKNLANLERAHLYALLAQGLDLAYLVDPSDPRRVISSDELETDPNLIALIGDLSSRTMALDSTDSGVRTEANRHVGLAINFIVGTPYIFAEEGR
jgi:hypothetical protein